MSNELKAPPENNPQLRVLLLGPFEAYRGTVELDIERRLPRFLLCYLAVARRRVPKAELQNLLNTGDGEEESRRSQGMYRLRDVLNKDQKQPFLRYNEGNDWLDLDLLYVDLYEFQNSYAELQPALKDHPTDQALPNPLVQKLEQALRLWRSPILFDSAPPGQSGITPWLESERKQASSGRHWMMDKLSAHYAAAGQPDKALGLLRQIAKQAPLSEEILLRQVNLLEIMGRQKEALKLLNEGIEEAQNEKLLFSPTVSQSLHRLHSLSGQRRPPPSMQLNWNIHGEDIPFIGRQAQLESISRSYYQGGSLFLLGESGVGKSRLLKTFASRLIPPPRIVLAHCHSTTAGFPFHPLVKALREAVTAPEWLSLDALWAGYLLPIFPELQTKRTRLRHSPQFSPEQNEAHLHQALCILFEQLAQNQRLLLILEDLQWADEATLKAISYLLANKPFSQNSVMLLSVRSDEITPAVQQLIDERVRAESGHTLEIGRLDFEEVTTLAQRYFGARPDQELLSHLHRDTGGNPLYVGEVLRALGSELPDSQQLQSLPFSSTLQQFLRRRLETLSDNALKLMQSAALLGHEFNILIAVRAAQLDIADGQSALQELLRRHLVEPLAGANYRFSHDKFREAQLNQLSALQIPQLHLRLAQAIENLAPDQQSQVAKLAHHYEEAGDYVKAFDYWVKAGQRNIGLYASPAALAAFQRAEWLLDCCAELFSDSQIVELYNRWADVLSPENDAPGLHQLSAHLRRLGETRASKRLLGLGLYYWALYYFTNGKLNEGLPPAARSLELLENAADPLSLARARTMYGTLLYMTFQLENSVQTLRQALNDLRLAPQELDTIAVYCSAYYELGLAESLLGLTLESFEHAHFSLEYATVLNQGTMLALSSSLTGMAGFFLGRYQEAVMQCSQGLKLAELSNSWRTIGYLHDYLAMSELALGHLDSALAHTRVAIAVGEKYERREVYSAAYRVLGDIFFVMGDPQTAMEHYSLACQKNTDTFLAPDHLLHLGCARVFCGQVGQGMSEIETGLQMCRMANSKTGERLGLQALGHAQSHLKDWDGLRSTSLALMNETLKESFPYFYALGQMYLGLVAFNQGDFIGAQPLFEHAIQRAAELRHWWLELHCRALLLGLQRSTGASELVQTTQIRRLSDHLQQYCQDDFLRPAVDGYVQHLESLLNL